MKKIYVIFMVILTIISSVVFAKEYSDLSSNHWAYMPINEMSDKGILSGYPDGTFGPDKSITRAEFAKILVLSLNLNDKVKNSIFSDVSPSFWGYDYINIASNYLSGYTDGNVVLFKPDDEAVREDVAVAVVMAAGLQNSNYNLNTLDKFSDKNDISENLKKYVAIAVENDLMHGNTNGTFNPKGKLTRAEVCQLMKNTTSELEKIAIGDNSKIDTDTKLPDFEYDIKTGILDLGEDWDKYYYSYSSNTTCGKLYTPSQRELNYTNYETIGKTICGDYAFVILKTDKSDMKRIEITNPFKDVKFDFSNGEIDLGSDYGKYLYGYSYVSNAPTGGNKYTPSQRTLKAQPDGKAQEKYKNGYKLNNGFLMDSDTFVTIYLLGNTDSFYHRRISEYDIYEYKGIIQEGKVVSAETPAVYITSSNSLKGTCRVYFDQNISAGTIEIYDVNSSKTIAKEKANTKTTKNYLEITTNIPAGNYILKTYNVKGLSGNSIDDYEKTFDRKDFNQEDFNNDNNNEAKEPDEETNIAVESVTLDKEKLTLKTGETATLKATVYPNNATNKELWWGANPTFGTSSITVYDGVVKAYGAGTYTITVFTSNRKTATCTVVVEESQIPGDVNMDWKVDKKDLTYLRNYLDTRGSVYNSIKLSEQAFKNANVNSDNRVSEIDYVVLEEYLAGGYKSLPVNVPEIYVEDMLVDKTDITLSVGETETVNVTIIPSNATIKSVLYGSTDEKIATVTHDGKIRGVSAGTAYIDVVPKGGTGSSFKVITVTVK